MRRELLTRDNRATTFERNFQTLTADLLKVLDIQKKDIEDLVECVRAGGKTV